MSVVAAITAGASNGAAAPTQGIALGQPNTAAPPPAQAPVVPAKVEAPKALEPYRFKREVSLNGKKTSVDLDELGIEREIATGRSAQQQLTRAQKQLEAQGEFNRLIEVGRVEEALAMKGVDIKAMIAANAQKAAQLAEMTPQEQRIAQLEDQLAQQQQKEQRDEQHRAEQSQHQRRQATQEQTKASLFETLKHVGYKLDGPENAAARGAALSAAARIQAKAMRAGHPPMTPQQLGAEVTRAFLGDLAQTARAVTQHPEFRGKHGKEVGAVFESLTHGLEGDALLDSMGPALLIRVVNAQMSQLGRRAPGQMQSQGGAIQQPGGIVSAPVSNEPGGQVLDFYTIEANGRKARGQW